MGVYYLKKYLTLRVLRPSELFFKNSPLFTRIDLSFSFQGKRPEKIRVPKIFDFTKIVKTDSLLSKQSFFLKTYKQA